MTRQFDIQLGGRESHNNQTYTQTQTGVYNTVFYGLPFSITDQGKDQGRLILPTSVHAAQFKVSDNLMVYSRLASGYRPGGPNPLSTVFGVPRSYAPDTTKNYEIGVKGDLFHRALTFDASVYYIDWKNIQLIIVDPVSFPILLHSTRVEPKVKRVEFSVESETPLRPDARGLGGLERCRDNSQPSARRTKHAGRKRWEPPAIQQRLFFGKPGIDAGAESDKPMERLLWRGGQLCWRSNGAIHRIPDTAGISGVRQGRFTYRGKI